MITAYNKYINTKTLSEKLEIDLPTSVDGVNTKVSKSFDKVKNKVFMENTSDGYEIKPEEEYYAIVQYKIDPSKLKDNPTAVMNDKIFWATLKLTPEDLFYKYQVIGTDVDVPKSNGSILDESNRQYIKIVKSPLEKIPVNRINGFYLYKVKSDINMILNSYHVKYDKKDIEKTVDNTMNKVADIKVGNVYQITNSKGKEANIRIIKREGDEIFARNIDNNQTYDNMKIETFQNAKEINPYKYIKSKLEGLKMSNWKNSDSFKEVSENKAEAIKYITKKYNKVGYYKDALEAWKKYKIENGTDADDPIIGGVDAAIRTTDNIRNFINNDLKKVYGIDLKKKKEVEASTETPTEEKPIEKTEEKPVEDVEIETVEDQTETPEEKTQKEEVKDMDTKAKEVQTDIQKSSVKKNKPIKQEKKPEPVKEEKPELVQASKNYKEFINDKYKKL